MNNNLKWLVLAMVSVALIIPGAALAKTFKIGVTVIVSHPALESDQKGFEKAIAEAGLEAEYDYQNAQGDMANATTIAQKFKNDDLDLVHAIATPTSQAAVKVIKNHPIVYSSVTDPVDAGLEQGVRLPPADLHQRPGPGELAPDRLDEPPGACLVAVFIDVLQPSSPASSASVLKISSACSSSILLMANPAWTIT